MCGAAAEVSDNAVREVSMPPKASPFTLQDQHDRTHRVHFPQDTVSVLLFADYAGSAQLEDWIRPLYARYQQTIGLYGVAELSVVPGFIRGLVRQFLQERVQYPVLLDWHGTVSKRYNYQHGQTNLVVIDSLGHIVYTVIGAADTTRLHQVMTQIDRLLSP
jgi:hypothetical protein